MRFSLLSSLILPVLLWLSGAVGLGAAAPEELSRYNVVWDTPSYNAAGSMPIGNGEVGLNVWVEENGGLVFYVSRTDAWSETCRLLKLGCIRLSLSPNPFVKGAPFRQELKLGEGAIEITAGAAGQVTKLKVFVDADAPAVHVVGESDQPLGVRAAFETWRTSRKVLTGEELSSSWTMRDAPAGIATWEAADCVISAPGGAVEWYHRNEYSCVPVTLKLQGLDGCRELVKDPLLHRTFGGLLSAPGFTRAGPQALRSPGAVRRFAVQLATHSAQTDTVAQWEEQLSRIARSSANPGKAARATAAWWGKFWNRSWIFLEEAGGAPSPITRAYTLQRWMAACAGRGNYPIKFNGSIFTVDPEFTGGPRLDPDWRKWGDCFWWQNSRFPPFAALACGDYEECRALFRLYREALPLCQARAQLYYGAQGAYFPETITIFGTYANYDYGWNREGHQPNEVLCPWWQYAWQQGLELVTLMQDYYDHTGDRRFLEDQLLPMAHEVLLYFDTRFARDSGGKLVISPTQAVETYWYGVTNDMPSVAGLHAVLDRLLALPPAQASAAERQFWLRLEAAAPPVPVRAQNTERWLLPAETFDPRRSNCENPELYAVWPFRLFGVGKPDLQAGIEAFKRRVEKGMKGWSYDGECAAILGLTDEAKRQILYKVGNSNPIFRFPAMWGPNFDWLPDQDHGSNIMLTLQNMLLFADGDKIQLLPAWPKEWNVYFKLHAPRQTVVEARVNNGRLTVIKVTPASRRKDVVIPSQMQGPS